MQYRLQPCVHNLTPPPRSSSLTPCAPVPIPYTNPGWAVEGCGAQLEDKGNHAHNGFSRDGFTKGFAWTVSAREPEADAKSGRPHTLCTGDRGTSRGFPACTHRNCDLHCYPSSTGVGIGLVLPQYVSCMHHAAARELDWHEGNARHVSLECAWHPMIKGPHVFV